MNTYALAALLQNPRVLVGSFIAEPLPSAVLAYGLMWFFLRPKDGRKIQNYFLWHMLGILLITFSSAAIRIFAMITFAGRSAYEPSAASGAMGIYYFLVPMILAYAYISWVKRRAVLAPTNNPEPISNEELVGNIDDALFAQVAKELVNHKLDDGLWAKAYSLENGDEKKTKAHYIRLRVDQLAKQSIVALPSILETTTPSQQENKSGWGLKVTIAGAALFGLFYFLYNVTGNNAPAPQGRTPESFPQASQSPNTSNAVSAAQTLVGKWSCQNTANNYIWETSYYEDGVYSTTHRRSDSTWIENGTWGVRDGEILTETTNNIISENRVSWANSNSSIRLDSISADGRPPLKCSRKS